MGLHTIQQGMLNSDRFIWLIAILCMWLGLGSYGVLNNNEGLYAAIAQDMLSSGDLRHWIIPHLNGLPYMEKPPLLYWLVALAFLLFGQAEWVVRLAPTLAGLLCVGLIMVLGRQVKRPALGRFAALMFITSVGVMCLARTLLFDMLMTALMTAAFVFAYAYLRDGRKNNVRIAYVSLGLAVLTKGFIAVVLFGLVVTGWLMLIYGWAAWKEIHKWFELKAFGLFLLIVLPWLIAASMVEPIFPWFFFINEHLLRFLGERIPHDYYSGPWWYYIPRLILFMFPWSLLIPIALCSKRSTGEPERDSQFEKIVFLTWLIPLLFFSVSSNKANYYCVVVMPFVAFSVALFLEKRDYLQGKRSAVLGGLIGLLALAAVIGLQFSSNLYLSKLVAVDYMILGLSSHQFAITAMWVFVAVSFMSACIAWRWRKVGIAAYVLMSFFCLGVILAVLNIKDTPTSSRSMAQFIQHALPNRSIYLYHHFEQTSSLPFYLKKPLKVIDSKSHDLYWGNKLRPGNSILISSQQFKEELASHPAPAAVVVPNEYVIEFTQQHWPVPFLNSKRYAHETLFY